MESTSTNLSSIPNLPVITLFIYIYILFILILFIFICLYLSDVAQGEAPGGLSPAPAAGALEGSMESLPEPRGRKDGKTSMDKYL